MDSFLSYFGNSTYFLPLVFGVNLLSIISIIYCRLTGPLELAATLNMMAPMILALGLALLLFYSPTFWPTWGLYFVVWGLSSALSFYALEASLEDKTGLGVSMASGFVGMMCFTGAPMLKGILFVFGRVFS